MAGEREEEEGDLMLHVATEKTGSAIHSERLIEKFRTRDARVAVIGLGYVGLPLAVEFAEAGFDVVGIDTDGNKVKDINRGRSHIRDVPSEELASLVKIGRLRADTDYGVLGGIDAVMICVPTPLNKIRDPDLSYVVAAAEGIVRQMHRDMLVVLESTTYPGTTDELVLPILEKSGLQVGEDFYLVFSPERIDPGNRKYNVKNIPKIVGGVTPRCLEVAKALYESTIEVVISVSSTKSAEMVKLLENTFRAVNIGLVNEVAIMCDKLGIDVWEVVDAAATKPFGFMPFYPGPGLGGHCIPVDPNYLSWKLRTLNYNARFIQLASEINTAMPLYVVNKVADALNDERKSVKGSRIMVLGVAYKEDVDDVRQSPALDILRLLKEKGAEVLYNDPFIPTLCLHGLELQSADLSQELLREMDCVVIVAAHGAYHWEDIVAVSNLVVDTRNVTKGIKANPGKIVRL